jgi:antitoxin MazE
MASGTPTAMLRRRTKHGHRSTAGLATLPFSTSAPDPHFCETSSMKTRIVRIGNSQCIRIPKPLLEQIGLEGEVEITAEGRSLVIRLVRKPREGWAVAFQEMARRGDDFVAR